MHGSPLLWNGRRHPHLGPSAIEVPENGRRVYVIRRTRRKFNGCAARLKGRGVSPRHPLGSNAELGVRQTQAAAPGMGIALEYVGVQRPDEFESAFSSIIRQGVRRHRATKSDVFCRSEAPCRTGDRLPTMVGERDYADAGGLIVYGDRSR
jgi:hypothetical protein